jgi:hypothetical protein
LESLEQRCLSSVTQFELKDELRRFASATGVMSTVAELSGRCRGLETQQDILVARLDGLTPTAGCAAMTPPPKAADPFADPATLEPRLPKGSAVLVADESWDGLRRGVILDQNPCDADFVDVRLDGSVPYSDEWFFVAAWERIVPAASSSDPPAPPPAPPRRVRAHRR